MKKKLLPVIICALCVFNSNQLFANQENNESNIVGDDISVGVGAISGALIAGPIGFFFGGMAGALVSLSDGNDTSVAAELDEFDYWESETESVASISNTDINDNFKVDADISRDETEVISVDVSNEDESHTMDKVLIASASGDAFVIEHEKVEEPNKLKAIITDGLNIMVHFTPGSVAVEPFYHGQFLTVLNLLNELSDVQLTLSAYSDRRGTDAENLQLASQRAESIREYFVQQGIGEERITIHAYGENNPLSMSGELESYMFDRRVVLGFKESSSDSQKNMAEIKPVTATGLSDSSVF